ncbi:MAG: archaellin/type IV pilin N-terminal domain-containing protein [Candidatus Bathyarchaeia archaeon]
MRSGNGNLKSFRRNLKGISPIFATLILISIVVIASVVVYMFTSRTFSTMTGSGTGATERVSVLVASITVNGTGTGVVSVYAESKSGINVSVSNIIIKDATGKVVTTVNPSTTSPYSKSLPSSGDLVRIGSGHLTLTGVTKGNAYSLTVISTKGSSFTSSTIVAN